MEPGWQTRMGARKWWLLALVAVLSTTATASLGLVGIAYSAFVVIWSVIAAVMGQRGARRWRITRYHRRLSTRHQGGQLQIVAQHQRERVLPDAQFVVVESFRLAGFAMIMGVVTAGLGSQIWEVSDSFVRGGGFAVVAVAYAMVFLPVAAWFWGPSWVPRRSQVRMTDLATHSNDPLPHTFRARMVAPTAGISMMLVLAKQIEGDPGFLARLSLDTAFVFAAFLVIGPMVVMTSLLIDILGREVAYERFEAEMGVSVVEKYGGGP